MLDARVRLRFGPARLAPEIGVPARTISRILTRHQVPPLAWLDPVTGAVIRAFRSTANRYERENPGELVHVDVKKLGRIPRRLWLAAHGRSEQVRGRAIGFNYVHAGVDVHTRLAYAIEWAYR